MLFDPIPPDDPAADQAVSPSIPARFLLNMIRDYSRKNGYCWMLQATMGEILGVTDRTIRSYLGELRRAGLVDVQRRPHHGRTRNFYRPVLLSQEGSDRKQPEAGFRSQPEATGSRLPVMTGSNRKQASGHMCISPENKTETHQQPMEDAAAAVARKLVERGLGEPEAKELAAADAELAGVVLPFHAALNGRGELKKPAGALVSMLRNPGGWGIRRSEAGWQLPTDGPARRSESERVYADALRRAAQRAGQATEDPQAVVVSLACRSMVPVERSRAPTPEQLDRLRRGLPPAGDP